MMGEHSFGALLRRYRLVAGLTQAKLAERAGVSERAVTDLERHPTRLPRLETAGLLATALDLPAAERTQFIAAAQPRTGVAPVALPRSWAPPVHAAAPLIGRTQEMALIAQHLRPSGPPVLVLAGEPGIGKTRLLEEAQRRGATLGWQVLSGACQRRGDQEPYAPLLDAVAQTIGRLSASQRRIVLRGCAWLSRLLPELAADDALTGAMDVSPLASLPPAQERRLIFDSVARFLVNVAGPRGALLVLDDLQWAGVDALDLLTTLARAAARASPGEPTLRLVSAYRDTEVRPDEPLVTTLADLAHAGLVTHHTLSPLSEHETDALLATLLPQLSGTEDGTLAEVSATFREHLAQRTGGVPFFVTSCAGALADATREGIDLDSSAALEPLLPWTVTQSVRQQIARLPAETRELLGAAAVGGREVSVSLLARVVGRSHTEVLDALDASSHIRLLEDNGAGGYRFSHDIVREVVEAGVTSARRAMVHQRVAEALEETSPRPLDRLAFHYGRSGVMDKAILYLDLAGDHALAQRAHAAASGDYGAMVARLDDLGRPLDAARAREKWAGVLRLQGHYGAARDELERAAAAYQEAGDQNSIARTVAHLGELWRGCGKRLEGVARLRQALETVDQEAPSHGLAELYAVLANLLSAGGHFREQLAAAERGQEMARRIGDGRTEMLAAAPRGHALHQMGRGAEARAVLTAALAQAGQEGPLDALLPILVTLTDFLTWTGEFAAARQTGLRALAVAREMGERGAIAGQTWLAAWPSLLQGEWPSARAEFEEAITLFRALGPSWGLSYALCGAGWLAHVQGRWQDAVALLDESIDLAERTVNPKVQRIGQTLRAELDILQGQPGSARARLINLLDQGDVEEVDVTFLLATLAWAELERGALATARETVTTAVHRGRAQEWRIALVEALRVQALVALREGRVAEAESALEEGVALARSMVYPYMEGRLQHVATTLFLQTDRLALATERLAAAQAIFLRLGARRDAAQVTQDLAALAMNERGRN